MMGRQEVQEALFYRFRIEDHVPTDHLSRRIDWLLDFGAIRHELEGLYSHTGRPSVDPELMIRMLLIGYLYGIRSERRLVDEVQLNLAYRWFCRLGLEGRVPDRSTFSKNRHGRFADGDILRRVFEMVVVNLGLLDPIVQGLQRAADLRRNRHDRLPPRSVLTLIVEDQPHRTFAHFRGKLVRCLAHDAPSYSGVGASGKPGAVQDEIKCIGKRS
jgi:transposase